MSTLELVSFLVHAAPSARPGVSGSIAIGLARAVHLRMRVMRESGDGAMRCDGRRAHGMLPMATSLSVVLSMKSDQAETDSHDS
jgi:hypothetical protein